jgi:hypothetical protein
LTELPHASSQAARQAPNSTIAAPVPCGQFTGRGPCQRHHPRLITQEVGTTSANKKMTGTR